MISDERLAKCERAGNVVVFTNPTIDERDALALVYGALRAQGHSVVADEVQHADGPTELRVHHYRTCLKCAGAR